jgi:multidrug efflux pump
MYVRMPTSFLPDEDQGSLITLVQLPAGATAQRTETVMKQVEDFVPQAVRGARALWV